MPQAHPTFLACRRCGIVQWFTLEYINHFGTRTSKCRRCLANDWRPANVYPTLRERAYLMRWFVWQQWFVNRRGTPGADPYWYYKPWCVWKVLAYGWRIMEQYNRVDPEGDNEFPRNIETMRSELSRDVAGEQRPLPHPACLLPRKQPDTV